MTVELLYIEGCPSCAALLPRLQAVLENAGVESGVELRRVESDEQARRLRFLGSPTVRVDGRDIESGAGERRDYALKCRLYRTPDGLVGVPPDSLIVAAIRAPGLAA